MAAIKGIANWNEVPLTAARIIEALQQLAPDAPISSISVNWERIAIFDGAEISEWRFAESSDRNLRRIRAHRPGILPALPAGFRRGDLVRTWYDEGIRSGGGYVFGVVTKAGPRTFTVRWESGNVQTRPQGCAACSLIPEDEITLARTALGIAEEGST